MFARLVLLACLMAIASPATALDSQNRAEPKGWGILTCQQFLDEIKKNDQEFVARAASWLYGFITAHNIYREETYDVAPWQDAAYLLNLIARNCQRASEQRIVTVVHALHEFLREARLKEWEEKLVATSSVGRKVVYKSILLDVQRALAEKGYLKGAVDGTFGPMTRTALEDYQKAEGLPVTGLPDALTVERLVMRPRAAAAQPAPQAQPQPQPATQ